MNRENFLEYVKEVLVPTLKKGNIVIMDNLSCVRCTAIVVRPVLVLEKKQSAQFVQTAPSNLLL